MSSASQPSWRPNLPESQLFIERTRLQGTILSAVAYGVNLAIFTQIVSLFITRLKVDIKHDGPRASRQTIYLLIYVCVMFILSTLAVASQAEMTQLSFIDNRDFPGGPAAYQKVMFSIPIKNLGDYCSCLMNWFSDSLLLWRCSVVYKSSRTSIWLIMAMPGLMLLASFVTGTIYEIEKISRPSSSPWAKTAFKPDLSYSIITLSLNILLTLMIVIRLYLHRRRLIKLSGPSRHAAHYTSTIESMLIESAAILVIVALWFLILFGMGSPLANIPMASAVQVQVVASYMIIFRVAKGTAWTSRTAYESEFTVRSLSNIRFTTLSVQHPADSRVMLDTESNSRFTVYECSH